MDSSLVMVYLVLGKVTLTLTLGQEMLSLICHLHHQSPISEQNYRAMQSCIPINQKPG